MQRVIPVILLFLLLLSSSGCNTIAQSRKEINDLLIINAFAIDKSKDNPGNVRITVSSKKAKSIGNNEKGGKSQDNVSRTLSFEGKTVLEAARRLRTIADRRPFYGHMEYILIGEETAKKDLLKYLDVLERDYEIRLNSLVVVVKSGTGEEVLDKANTGESTVADRLKNLFANLGGMSFSDKVELADLMSMLDNKYLSSYIPCISLVKTTEKEELKKDGFDMQLDGFAVFKGDDLLGYITENEGRGFNWIRGKVGSGTIVVKDEKNESISLEIIDSSAKITPKITKDNLSVSISIKMSSNVDEIMGTEDIFNENTFRFLEKQQEDIIKSEIERVVAYAQKNNADFIGIGDAVNHKYPVKWEKIKNNWNRIFPTLVIDVSVESKINRTYDIREPTRSESEKDK